MMKAIGFLLENSPIGLAKKAWGWVTKGCGCFVPGTQVWTSWGLVSIEEINEGDEVMSFDESTGQVSFRRVLNTFMRPGAAVVAVTLTLASGQAAVIETTEEHPFHSVSGWVRADQLIAGDAVTSLNGNGVVESVSFTNKVSTVHNFEVEGLHNYFVSDDGVLVHNTSDQCKNLYSSIKKAPTYPAGFRTELGGARGTLTKNKINDPDVDAMLKDALPGSWHKIYKDGFVDGRRVSIHYFEHSGGTVFNVKVKDGWSN